MDSKKFALLGMYNRLEYFSYVEDFYLFIC